MTRLLQGLLRPALGAVALASVAASAGAHPSGDSVPALDRALQRAAAEIARRTELYEDHSTWDKAWVVDSEHYEVRTVESFFLANDVATGLDVMYGHFCETLGLQSGPPGRMRIDILPDLAAYNQIGQTYDQHSSFYGCFYADRETGHPVVSVRDPNPTMLRMQITHGALHQFLAAEFPQGTPPTWVVEGLASYFSIYWDYGWGLAEFERVRKEGNLTPLARLFREDVSSYVQRPHGHMMELGLLFYYLLRFRDDTRTRLPEEEHPGAPFRDWLLATLRGEETARLPFEALLRDPARLDQDFRAYQFPR
jgi:hypothetical protein